MKYNKTALCQMMGDKGIFFNNEKARTDPKKFHGELLRL